MTKFSISKITGIILFIILIAALTISTYAENGKYVVILDPGHGGVDGGTDEGAKTEKEYNFIIAQKYFLVKRIALRLVLSSICIFSSGLFV